jgi:hypothetical protein
MSNKHCRHQNGTLYRELRTWSMWDYVDGRPIDDGWTGEADATGVIRIVCTDCGYDHTYSLAQRPMWVQTLMDNTLLATRLSKLTKQIESMGDDANRFVGMPDGPTTAEKKANADRNREVEELVVREHLRKEKNCCACARYLACSCGTDGAKGMSCWQAS